MLKKIFLGICFWAIVTGYVFAEENKMPVTISGVGYLE